MRFASYLKEENPEFQNKYYSSFYKDLLKDAPALELYNYILSVNKKLAERGNISYREQYTFIPYITSSMLETSFSLKGTWRKLVNQFRVVSGEEYGSIDPATGGIRRQITVPFTENIFGNDFSEMSFDLIANYSKLTEAMERIHTMADLESYAFNLLELEKSKKVIPVGKRGIPLKQEGTKTNLPPIESDTNYNYLAEFVDTFIYGQYISGALDKIFEVERPITKVNEQTGETEVVGHRKEYYSLARMINQSVKWMYQTTFGLNVFTPMRQYIASIGHSIFTSGIDFTGGEILRNERFWNKLKFKKNNDKDVLAVEYIMPYLDEEFRQQNNLMSAYGVKRWINGERGMALMRLSSRMTQANVANAVLSNMIVVDGEVHSVRRYVDSLYPDYYNLSKEEQKRIDNEKKLKIEQLKKDNSILNNFIIKKENRKGKKYKAFGVDTDWEYVELVGLNNVEEARLKIRNLIQFYTQQITGEQSGDEMMLYQRQMLGKMMGMYRNWIPRTLTARVGKMDWNEKLHGYEWGRWGAYGSSVYESFKDKGGLNAMKFALGFAAKEELIKYAQSKYLMQKEVFEQQNRMLGPEGFIKENEFIKLYLNNYRKSIQEYRLITGMMILLTSGLLAAGEGDSPDEKAKKAMFRFHFDRLVDEFSFYVNPLSFTDIAGNAFPAASFYARFVKTIMATIKEPFLMAFNPEAAERNHVIKGWLRTIPVASEITKLLPIIDPELAKEYGIKPVSIISRF
jgi:hypothetical protein